MTNEEDRSHIADLDAALGRLNGSRQLLLDVIAFFLEDAPALLQEARRGLDNQEAAQVRRASHGLKGLAATFDAQSVVTTAREIELHADRGDLDSLPELLDQLEMEVNRLIGVLNDYSSRRRAQS